MLASQLGAGGGGGDGRPPGRIRRHGLLELQGGAVDVGVGPEKEAGPAVDSPSVVDDELAAVRAIAATLFVCFHGHIVRDGVAHGRRAVVDAAIAPIRNPIGDFLEKGSQVSIHQRLFRAH